MNAKVRLKIAATLLALVFGALSLFGLALSQYFSSLIAEYLGKEASAVAVAVSWMVQPRMAEYRLVRSEADRDRPFYRQMRGAFQSMKGDNFIRFVYTERRISDKEIEYVLDAEPDGSEYSSPPGSRDAMNPLRERAYALRAPVFGPLTDDPAWGRYITGYAPLVDPATGEFAGLAGVDIEAGTIHTLFGRIRLVIAGVILLLTLMAAFPVYRLAAMIARQITLDGLTGAILKKHLMPDLAARLAKGGTERRPISVLVIDFDRFKNVNDSFGHAAGDLALKLLTHEMRSGLRADDRLYRYGGEEFVLVMQATGERCLEAAERLRARVAAKPVEVEEGRSLTLTVSIGAARWTSGISPEELVGRADDAMYAAKRSGGNAVMDYDALPPAGLAGGTAPAKAPTGNP
ncbi:MAG: GGDEF domain-containing protein [Spirochaetaceae bacterium]|nr:GGDEF domain-containing protein [Spirochaetaceae bacterium]